MSQRGRILFAWQLGANYGHLMTDLPIAKALIERGHDVSFIVADAHIAAEILAPLGIPFRPAPPAPEHPAAPHPASFAEIMQASGFGDDRGLDRMLDPWTALLRQTADVVVADHAPMALLAAYLLDIPAVVVGNGFTIPPLASPLPCTRPWEDIPVSRLQQAEHNVLNRINAVVERHHKRPLRRLAELFVGRKTLLTTFPELDPHADRDSGTYVGCISSQSTGAAVSWGAGPARRVFAYLRPTVPRIAAILTALEELDGQVIVAMPGAGADLRQHFASTNITLVGGAVPLVPLLSSADVVVGYGGAGMIASALLAGVPMLLVPENAEQYLGSMQVAKLGAGIFMDVRKRDRDVAPALARLLQDPGYRAAARAFAAKYRAFDSDAAADLAASMILECLPGSTHE